MIEVVDPGLLLTLQDGGRGGWGHLGVPRSGAADPQSLAAANLQVGNRPGTAAFETTLTGASLLFHEDAEACVAGAPASLSVDGEGVPFGQPIAVAAGSVLEVGPAKDCVRSYVAIAGGLEADEALGSVSADLLTGLGPPPLGVGDRVALARRTTAARPDVPAIAAMAPEALTIAPGPRSAAGELADELAGVGWEVLPASNRIGVRLRPAVGDPRPGAGGLVRSVPIPRGAVQMTVAGELIALLADSPTTGGYPLVGVLTPESLLGAGRLRPGAEVDLAMASRSGT